MKIIQGWVAAILFIAGLGLAGSEGQSLLPNIVGLIMLVLSTIGINSLGGS